jgi:hypothetical protein
MIRPVLCWLAELCNNLIGCHAVPLIWQEKRSICVFLSRYFIFMKAWKEIDFISLLRFFRHSLAMTLPKLFTLYPAVCVQLFPSLMSTCTLRYPQTMRHIS